MHAVIEVLPSTHSVIDSVPGAKPGGLGSSTGDSTRYFSTKNCCCTHNSIMAATILYITDSH